VIYIYAYFYQRQYKSPNRGQDNGTYTICDTKKFFSIQPV
jgi:hypothetical protein